MTTWQIYLPYSAIKEDLYPRFFLWGNDTNQIGKDNLVMDIGRAILEIRKQKSLKQEAVALDAGTNTGYLSRIEKGSRCPSLPMLEKFAIALGIKTSELVMRAERFAFDVTDSKADSSNLTDLLFAELSLQFVDLTPESQKIAVELLRALNRTQKIK